MREIRLFPLIAVAHLGGEGADVVFIEQMAERPHLHLQKVGGAGLVAGGLAQSFDDIGFFKDFQVGDQVQAVVRQIEFGLDACPDCNS